MSALQQLLLTCAPSPCHSAQALYRGNGANVARLIPDVAFKFAVHDQFKLMFAPQDGSPPGVQEKMAAGAATGRGRWPLFMLVFSL
jgi:hypothetical protein